MNANQPNPGQIYAALWADYIAATRQYSAAENALGERERKALPNPGDPYWPQVFSGSEDWQLRDQYDTHASAIVSRLVRLAVERFTPAGCRPLEIPYEPHRHQFIHRACNAHKDGMGVFLPERFDPAALWSSLVADYSGDQAAQAVNQAAARSIATTFNLRPGAPVVRRAAGIVVSCRVWVDRALFGKDRLGFSSANEISAMLGHLATFATWAEDDSGLAAGARAMAEHIARHDYEVQSRQRFMLGRRSFAVTYLTRFEFMIGEPLASQLQIFLSVHGQQAEAEAA